MKTRVGKFDITELQTVPVDFKKLSNTVDIDVAKKAVFHRLNQNVVRLENEIPSTSLINKTV